MLRLISVSLLATLGPLALAQPSVPTGPADTIYYRGYILTGESLTGSLPRHVTAIAVRDGLVEAVGSDPGILALKGPKTELIDLQGAFVMPGLNDAHVHLGAAGRQKLAVDLDGVASLAEMKERIRAAAQKAVPGTWLLGGGWDHTKWADKTLPTSRDLDAVTGDHPAFFERTDGHIGVANSAALRAAGIDAHTPDPQGGKFDHEIGKTGAPLTGIVRDTAMEQLESHEPEPSPALRREALALALDDASSHGLTSLQDNSDWEDFLAFEALEQEGKLTSRVSEWLAFSDPLDVLKQHRAAHSHDDRMLHTTMLKGFLDGSLGSRTAALNAPYSDDPGNSGLTRYQQTQLNAMTTERMAAGFQIGFHAIGDHAVEMALEAFAQGEAANPDAKNLRPRIEHSQVLDAGDFKRYKELGVIASMQPNHLLTDMNWAEARLDPLRARYSYAWDSFLKYEVPLAFGTDYPVEPITPFRGIYAAVTRQNEPSEGHKLQTYFPAERLTIGQALYAYTQGSAYAEFAESWKGLLIPGYVADLVVLDRNLMAIPAPDILNTQVMRTVVAGKTVYLKSAAPAQ
jgi:predicted amidohydrolase YtcJ